MYAKIKDHPFLFRDMSNKHIVQTDLSVIRKHEARQKAIDAAQKRDAEITAIKCDIQELKGMMQQLMMVVQPFQQSPPYTLQPLLQPFMWTSPSYGITTACKV